MLPDWSSIERPIPEEIAQLTPIPGVKFDINRQGIVERARFHRSVWPVIADWPMDGPALIPPAHLVKSQEILRSYQRADLPFLLSRHSSILGYEMRLGKTATASCAHDPERGPLLIVGPLIARDVWRDWTKRVHGFEPIALESKNDIPLPGFPGYFVHFDILDAHSGFLQTLRPATLVIDEIHMLQARKSLRMSTMSLIAPNAQRIIGLSGTPMWSNPRSMWPILNLLAPGAWGSEFEFCQRYMNAEHGAYGWKYSGTKNEAEFRNRLSEVLIRRTWHDVAPSLPPTTNVTEPVCVTPSVANKLAMQCERSRLSKGASYQSTVSAIAGLRKSYGLLKVKRAVELALDAMSNGHKVVFWTWHTEVAAALYDAMPTPTRNITADDSQDMRALAIHNFQRAVKPEAFIVPLAVGGVAIDLSSADVNIFVELDWIPATNYQASMRVFRPDRPHSNVFLFLDVPVERRLIEVLGANEACQTASGLGYDEIAAKVLEQSYAASI